MPEIFQKLKKADAVYDKMYKLLMLICKLLLIADIALAIRRNAHIRMTSFDRYLPKKVVKTLDVVADIAVLILGIIMLVIGMQYALQVGAKGRLVSLPKVSKFWQYFPIPLAGFFMIVFEIEQVTKHIEAFFIPDDKEAKA